MTIEFLPEISSPLLIRDGTPPPRRLIQQPERERVLEASKGFAYDEGRHRSRGTRRSTWYRAAASPSEVA